MATKKKILAKKRSSFSTASIADKRKITKEAKLLIDQPKLNLACGKNPMEGFFGIDKTMIPGKVNAVVDLMIFPWPIKSESADEIVCSHFIEHLTTHTGLAYIATALAKSNTFIEWKKLYLQYIGLVPEDGLIAFMNEIHRILKKGGIARFVAPYWSSMRSCQDPTHRRNICEASLLYFNKKWREDNGLDHYETSCDFDYNYGYNHPEDLNTKSPETKAYLIAHEVNIVYDVVFQLTKR